MTDEPLNPDRRRQDRRWRERRLADHPVFLDTRLPSDRRATDRRKAAAETKVEEEDQEGDPRSQNQR